MLWAPVVSLFVKDYLRLAWLRWFVFPRPFVISSIILFSLVPVLIILLLWLLFILVVVVLSALEFVCQLLVLDFDLIQLSC